MLESNYRVCMSFFLEIYEEILSDAEISGEIELKKALESSSKK